MKQIGFYFGVRLLAETDSDDTAERLARRLADDTGDLPLLPEMMRDDLAAARQSAAVVEAADLGKVRTDFRRAAARYFLACYSNEFETIDV